jgi:3-phenylpropionate/trans-cinnamate dioxygenase ferredoxin component
VSSTSAEIRVAAVGEIAEGEARRIPAEQTGHSDAIAVFNDEGTYYALDDTCTHGQASLAEGWVEDGEVECMLHSARFDLKSGEALCMPAVLGVRPHRVEVRDGEVWLHPNRETAG